MAQQTNLFCVQDKRSDKVKIAIKDVYESGIQKLQHEYQSGDDKLSRFNPAKGLHQSHIQPEDKEIDDKSEAYEEE